MYYYLIIFFEYIRQKFIAVVLTNFKLLYSGKGTRLSDIKLPQIYSVDKLTLSSKKEDQCELQAKETFALNSSFVLSTATPRAALI